MFKKFNQIFNAFSIVIIFIATLVLIYFSHKYLYDNTGILIVFAVLIFIVVLCVLLLASESDKKDKRIKELEEKLGGK
jgi:putative effector of murein hydrolase